MATLHTTRLTLRPLKSTDAPFILRLLTDPSFLHFIGDRGVKTEADAHRYIAGPAAFRPAQSPYGMRLIARRDDQTRVGIGGILRRDTLPDPDLGYALLPDYWGNGYATEVARALAALARDTLHLPRLLAITAPDNTASMRVLAKTGFQPDGLIRLEGAQAEVALFVLPLTL